MTAPADELAWQEWLLSDHPDAMRERASRRAVHHDQVVAWHEERWAWAIQVLADLAAAPGDRHRAWQIIDALPLWVAQAEIDAAEPDHVRVQRQRMWHEADRREGGEHGYRYPARYLGRCAAVQPVPRTRGRIAVAARSRRHGRRLRSSAERRSGDRERDGDR